MPSFADFGGFAGVIEMILHGKTQASFIIWMNCAVLNEIVFVLSFVSSNNTDVEATEQFILMHTRYVCDFCGLAN